MVLAFLLISCNCNVLNFIWHGFHFPNMLPYRFFFLFSFVLLVIGYRAFILILEESMKMWDILAMLLLSIAVFVVSYKVADDQAVFWTSITALLYCFIFFLYIRKIFNRKLFWTTMTVVICFEMFENTRIGTEKVSTSDYVSYPSTIESVSTLLDEIETQDDSLFYRMEISTTYTLNDLALYGYNGLSQFSSMANVSTTKWMRSLGLAASEAGNRYYYAGSSPVTAMFTGLRYLICRSGNTSDTLTWQTFATADNATAYENRYDLSVGFWTSADLTEYISYPDGNAFENQNTLFQLATGIDTPLFTAVEVDSIHGTDTILSSNGYGSFSYTVESGSDDAVMQFQYNCEETSYLYAYVRANDSTSVTVRQNGVELNSYDVSRQPYIFPLGKYTASDTANISIDLADDASSGVVILYVYCLNADVLDAGYEILSQGQLTLTEFSDSALSGMITAQEDGLCYFSIPYDSGWHAQVDGVDAEIEVIGNVMIAVSVMERMHTITLRYIPKGFVTGVYITIGSMAILLALWMIERKRHKPLLPSITSKKEEIMVAPDIQESLEILESQKSTPEETEL